MNGNIGHELFEPVKGTSSTVKDRQPLCVLAATALLLVHVACIYKKVKVKVSRDRPR